MKRFLRSSCLRLLLFVLLIGVAALSAVAILFQQSQAALSNTTATTAAQVTPTRRAIPPTDAPVTVVAPNDEVTIQTDVSSPTPQPAQIAGTNAVSSTPFTTPAPSSTPILLMTASDLPRYSGTSSYPLTITAEVMLAQTHVASYQAGVAATRTAVAAESVGIYATLTAAAPIVAPGAP